MRLLRLSPPYWWRPGLSETDELQWATEAARRRDMGAPQHIQRRAELKKQRRLANLERGQRALDKWLRALWDNLRQSLGPQKRERPAKGVGRHANPARAEIDLRNRQAVLGAVELAKARSPDLKGGRLYDAAYELLEDGRKTFGFQIPARGSVKSIYNRAVREGVPRNREIEVQLACVKQFAREI